MSVTMTVNGGKATIAKLQAMKGRTKRVDPAWREVGSHISKQIKNQFRTRGATFGTPWKPLAPSTVLEKKRKGYPRQPLVRTGKMKRLVTGRPLEVEQYAGQVATFGTKSKIALFQHGGTKRNGKRHIPARPIMKMTPKLRREIRDILKKHVLRGER